MVSIGFPMVPDDFNRRPSPDLRLCYVFLWSSIGFVIFLLCFWLILIVGPSPDPRSSYVFLWFCYVSDIFVVDFNRRLSPDLRLSSDFLLFPIVFL